MPVMRFAIMVSIDGTKPSFAQWVSLDNGRAGYVRKTDRPEIDHTFVNKGDAERTLQRMRNVNDALQYELVHIDVEAALHTLLALHRMVVMRLERELTAAAAIAPPFEVEARRAAVRASVQEDPGGELALGFLGRGQQIEVRLHDDRHEDYGSVVVPDPGYPARTYQAWSTAVLVIKRTI